MQTVKTLILVLLCSIASISPVIAMKKGSQPPSPAKRSRENSEMIDLTTLSLQSPEKKSCTAKNMTVTRTKKCLRWQETLVVGSNLKSLHPIETEEQEQVHVAPLAKAIFEDDVESLKSILNRQPHDLLCLTTNIVESTPAATLLDIAADRQSYKCLEYFQTLLDLPIPKDNLQQHVARMLYLHPDQSLLQQAQQRFPDIDIIATAENSHLYHTVVPNLVKLYTVAQHSAKRIARQTVDLRCANLLTLPKR